jgi:hypothetical protein
MGKRDYKAKGNRLLNWTVYETFRASLNTALGSIKKGRTREAHGPLVAGHTSPLEPCCPSMKNALADLLKSLYLAGGIRLFRPNPPDFDKLGRVEVEWQPRGWRRFR